MSSTIAGLGTNITAIQAVLTTQNARFNKFTATLELLVARLPAAAASTQQSPTVTQAQQQQEQQFVPTTTTTASSTGELPPQDGLAATGSYIG